MSSKRAKMMAAVVGLVTLGTLTGAKAGTLDLAYTGPTQEITAGYLPVSAVLTEDGAPVEAETVTFSLGEFVEVSDTDGNGVASTEIEVAAPAGSTVNLTVAAVDLGLTQNVAITVVKRPATLQLIGPHEAQLSSPTNNNATQTFTAHLIDNATGREVHGKRLVCSPAPCKYVADVIKARFKLGNLAEVVGQTGSPTADPPADHVISANIRPTALGFDVPLTITFDGNATYAATVLNTTVNVWERVDEDDNHLGAVYSNPSTGQFRVHTDLYDSGLVSAPPFTAASTAHVLAFNGVDANGKSLKITGLMRLAMGTFTGVADLGDNDLEPIAVLSRS